MSITSLPRKLALVGLGHIGIEHAKYAAQCPLWEVAYLCDLSDNRLLEAGKLVPSARKTTDFEQILADKSVEAVSINTLSNVRPDLIYRAVSAGKHVLCEKPLAPTAEEAQQLVERISVYDRLVTTNLFNRNAPYLRKAYDFISSGQIGRIGIIRGNHCTSGGSPTARNIDGHKAVEGHVLHDCGMHYVDVIRWFGGSDPIEFDTRAMRFWEREYELHFMVRGHLENEIMFDLHNGFCYTSLSQEHANHSSQEFIGTHGVVYMRHDFQTVWLDMYGRSQTIHTTMPYGGKKLDIYYKEFAEAIDSGDLGRLARLDDAVAASKYAKAMVDQALCHSIPNIGIASDLKL